MLLMRVLASIVTVSHSGDGYYNKPHSNTTWVVTPGKCQTHTHVCVGLMKIRHDENKKIMKIRHIAITNKMTLAYYCSESNANMKTETNKYIVYCTLHTVL